MRAINAMVAGNKELGDLLGTDAWDGHIEARYIHLAWPFSL